jgi:F0F1-type ATP synthase membrane subunit b/b'
MTINAEIIAIIFRVINFLVLIALGIYAFKKYALELIRADMSAEQEHLDGIKARAQELQQEKRDLEKGIKEDARACSLLREKITTWHSVAEQESHAFRAEREGRIEIVKGRAEKQAQAIELYRRQRVIVPAAIEKAQTLLEKTFASKDRAHSYVQQVIAKMEEST